MNTSRVPVSIVGASGYSGIELCRILSRHPSVTIEKLFAKSSAGQRMCDVAPQLGSAFTHRVEPYSIESACSSNAVFIALPSGEAMGLVPPLLEKGKSVIDLGGDFRLRDAARYEKYYKRAHGAGNLLDESVYGLPELNRSSIKKARLLANPGCYPTSVIVPLIPLVQERIVEDEGISVTSMSGVSGAGRSASAELSFVEVNESVKAYKVGVHQHLPEIEQTLTAAAGRPISLTFVPHLIPITRGIYTTITAPLRSPASSEEITSLFRSQFDGEPFVRIVSPSVPELKHVQFTNYIDISVHVDAERKRVIVCSAIDNLVKGAAGQAVQNFNLMFGFDETEGLR